MNVKYDHSGERFRECRDALSIMQLVEQWDDWPIKGPRTVRWCFDHMVTHAGTPKGWHQRWVSEMKLSSTDPGVDIHELACHILELMLLRRLPVTCRCRRSGMPSVSPRRRREQKRPPLPEGWGLEAIFASVLI